ncbi:hypothetical protein EDD37DRAFT_682606 [Exophiala viscosa]|uniref:uncharacterized protein n=1 Tax=Exophiala viscosa TaxID=2486360 RepID=UPI002195DBF2|nr:hypothetical protein EDD37DRAFT_682606 [Exophiala viscosa]
MPPSSPIFKVIKRVQQACENCRTVSMVVEMLVATARQPTGIAQALIGTWYEEHVVLLLLRSNPSSKEHRMAQLEDAMRSVISRTGSSDGPSAFDSTRLDARSETRSEQDDHRALSQSKSLTRPGFLHEDLLPPPDCLSEMTLLYRRHCHRQPVWLFDDVELASLSQQPEELLLAILALTTRFSANPYFHRTDRIDMAQRFGDAARNLVMLKIANAGVRFSTIQSLCLLAYAGFAARDTFLAPLHLNLARDLLRSAGFDLRSAGNQVSSADQPIQRLFWSIYLLEQLYGTQGNRTISLRDGLDNIHYCATVGDHARRPLTLEPPQIPEEASDHGDTHDQGIWNYTLCLSTLWNEVRNYIHLCASDFERAPWAPESYYTLIVSYMHELETQLPQPHRANCKWFFQCSLETLDSDRSYWTPWVFLQLSYHGIYTVINHPFLLTSRLQSLKLKIPNTFWRTSSEAALLHSTWIVRLISMARGKDFELSDPFLSWVVGVAASAQLFYCCSQNDELRLTARDNFDKCKAFIDDQANVWQWCRGIKRNLEKLAEQAFGDDLVCQPSQVISIDTTAILEIFDYSRCREADPARAGGRVLFDGSLSLRGDRAGSQLATMELSENISDAAGRPVAPPVWRPATASSDPSDRPAPMHMELLPDSAATPSIVPIEIVHDSEIFDLPTANFSDGLLQNIFCPDFEWWDIDA